MLKMNYGRSQSAYCFYCGKVGFDEDMDRIRLARGKIESFCQECIPKVPKHIPLEQRERWHDVVRKKHIQSDDQKRRKRKMG